MRRPAYRCPVCAGPLLEDQSGWCCAAGHRYDRAREGYVNLVPAGRRKGRPSGDDDSMVRARRTVFDAGLYAPIIDAVAATAHRCGHGATGAPLRVLDSGSGEGTYLAACAAAGDIDGWGIDISKAAARLAARRHRGLHFAVASAYQLPFDDASFDVVMSVFSPRPHAELKRVLDVGGRVVVVRPGPDHLAELKALLYDEPRRHRDPADEGGHGEDWPTPAIDVTVVQFDVVLDEPTHRNALLEMTPYWWSARPDRRREIAERNLTLHADIRVSVFGHDG